ncbi:MAG TPA: DMT family transporter [Solirubrobacteraceae bacterium]|nr:DMT family transporter [Solirubrobacteraceae bacterium]
MSVAVARRRLAAMHPRGVRGHDRAVALAGALTISFSSILVRVSGASPSTAAIFRCLYALPVLAWIGWREERRLGSRSRRERVAALIGGVFFGVDNLLWNRSIADVGAGLATVLGNIQVVVLPLVAWVVLRERPDRRIAAALPLTAAGVLMISGVLERGAYGRAPGAGTVLALAAGLTYVGFLLALRFGGGDGGRAAGPLADATLSATITCVVGGLALGDAHLVPAWPSAGWLVLLALGPQVLGWLLLSSSLPRLPAAIGALLLTAQPIASVVLGVVLLGEAPSALQYVGVALVLAALVMTTVAGAGSVARGRVPGDDGRSPIEPHAPVSRAPGPPAPGPPAPARCARERCAAS